MSKAHTAKLLVIAAAVVLPALSVVRAQQQPAQGGQPPPPQEPKNLQVLKGMARPQLIQVMREWSAALGVECNFCHQAPFETETPRKHVARLMWRDYVNGVKHKDGSAVSCKDCHQGQPNPLRTAPFANALGKGEPGLQIIKREQIGPVMQAFSKALGVSCEYCHGEGGFDAETPRKQIARYMMTEFSGKLTKADGSAMSCNDCHQGHALPLVHLPFPRREQHPQQQPAPAGAQGEKKPNS